MKEEVKEAIKDFTIVFAIAGIIIGLMSLGLFPPSALWETIKKLIP